jgi:hypothetical protein
VLNIATFSPITDDRGPVEAQPLIDMWTDTFLVQIEARTGSMSLVRDDSGRPAKRRKVASSVVEEENARAGNAAAADDFPMDGLAFPMDFDMPFMGDDYILPSELLKSFSRYWLMTTPKEGDLGQAIERNRSSEAIWC